MNILITGAKGFIGKNLISTLKNTKDYTIFQYDVDCEPDLLEEYAGKCDFVYHLAGINRPKEESEFKQGNVDFTETLLNCLQKRNNKSPIVMTSSIQAVLDNPYGKSKKASEQLVFSHSEKIGAPVFVYRLPNVFGKWCKPNYNSVVATFCHNISHGLPITINDSETAMNLVFIDDVVAEFVRALGGQANQDGEFYTTKPVYTVKLGQLAALIESFQNSRKTLEIPCLSDEFTKKLHSTYLSYISHEDFSYPLKMNIDNRGSFTEFIRTIDRGQVSINVSKPGIVKGNHWHHTKNEKFLVVSGEGTIRFRAIDGENVVVYRVCGKELRVVDIPPGYTHSIENTGDADMVTIMWANECFDPDNPDTYALEV